MYKWYFGEGNVPDDKANAIAQMVLGIGAGSLSIIALFVIMALWFNCVI